MEDLGFAVVLLLVSIWMVSWAILAATLAGFFHASPNTGALLGVTLGPLGLIATLALQREGTLLSKDSEPRSAPERLTETADVVDPFS